jgi:hypothetical protein
MASAAFFFQKKGARSRMPILKDLAVAGSALLVFLFVSGAYYGDDESDSRFDASLYESILYAPRLEEAAELRFARDITPADRVREVFARFVPSDNKRGKRYASAAAVIR